MYPPLSHVDLPCSLSFCLLNCAFSFHLLFVYYEQGVVICLGRASAAHRNQRPLPAIPTIAPSPAQLVLKKIQRPVDAEK